MYVERCPRLERVGRGLFEGEEAVLHVMGLLAGHWASTRRAVVAERAGFEPAVLSHTAFRERHHQPLGHLSAGEDTKRAFDGCSPASLGRAYR